MHDKLLQEPDEDSEELNQSRVNQSGFVELGDNSTGVNRDEFNSFSDAQSEFG
jgi:hypothetical protein